MKAGNDAQSASLTEPNMALNGIATSARMPRSLRLNVITTMLGWVAYTACQWGVLVLLARSGSPADVGRFGLALGVVTPLIMLFGMQLRPVLASDQQGVSTVNDYLMLRVVGIASALVTIFAITLSMSISQSLMLITMAMGLAKGIEAYGDIFLGVFQRHERMDLFSRSMVIRGVATVVFFAVVYCSTKNLLASVIAMALAWLLCILMHDAPLACRLQLGLAGQVDKRGMSRDRIIALAKRSAPLALVAGLMSLSTNLPRYFLYESHGEAVLGRFTALAYLIIAAQVVVASTSQSAIPRLSSYVSQGRSDEARRLGVRLGVWALLFGLACTLIAHLAGEELLAIVFDSSYSAYASELVLLGYAATLLFASHIAEACLRAQQRHKALLANYTLCTITLAFCCSIMVPTLGIRGAVYAILTTELVHFAASVLAFAAIVGGQKTLRFGEAA